MLGGPTLDQPKAGKECRIAKRGYLLCPFLPPLRLRRHRSQTLLGLNWTLATLADAMSFEVSLLTRTPFLQLLDNRECRMRQEMGIKAAQPKLAARQGVVVVRGRSVC